MVVLAFGGRRVIPKTSCAATNRALEIPGPNGPRPLQHLGKECGVSGMSPRNDGMVEETIRARSVRNVHCTIADERSR